MGLFSRSDRSSVGQAEKRSAEFIPQQEESTYPPSDSKAATSADNNGTGSFSTAFASLSMHMTDRIRLFRFPEHITQVIQQAIITSWPQGIQDTREYCGSYEFKLKGNPWRSVSDEATHSRRLMNSILEALFNNGWVLSLSTDVSKKLEDKDTLVFRHQDPAPAPHQWLCVSFSRTDRIRFYDAPPELVQDVCQQLLPYKQSDGFYKLPGVYEFKIRGNPWYPSGAESMYGRAILLDLITVMEKHGFTVYASIDQKSTSSDTSRETDTWHCCRAAGWTPGAPVFHS